MFRQLAQLFPGNLQKLLPSHPGPYAAGSVNANAVIAAHPYPLSRLMERAWYDHELRPAGQPAPPLAMPQAIFANEGNGAAIDRLPLGLPVIGLPYVAPWDHLIYAYMVENTRAFEIFRRVVRDYVTSERLPAAATASDPSMTWLRTAEELWLRDGSWFPIGNLISQVRPDFAATRRNAYFRMFGMDLNHGTDDGRPYPYEKPEAANRDFVRLFEALLSAVWIARTHRTNLNGANPTDDAEVARITQMLQEMLNLRKQGGQLRREEFVIVSMMSWFHVTLSFNSPIVQLLSATATTAGERLLRLGQRVGVAPHPRVREFLRLAENMSALLKLIESGMLSSPVTAPWLYAVWSPLSRVVDRVTTDWGIVTGRDIKAQAARVTGLSAAQLPATTYAAPAVAMNGSNQIVARS